MKLNHRRIDSIDLVEMSGRLVMADAPEARQRLESIIEQGSGKLIIDLSDVGFMDSSGLSVLISTFKQTRTKDGDVVLLNPSPAVRTLFELTRMQQVFDIVDDEAAAAARFG